MKIYQKVIIAISFFITSHYTYGAADTSFFYVSKKGNDVFDGSINKPFRTLEGACNYLRIKKAKLGKESVVVYLRAGIYFVQNTLRLTEADTLQGNAALIIKAYPNEYVALNGGVEITNQSAVKLTINIRDIQFPASARKHILKIDLKKLGITDFGAMHSYGFRRPIIPAAIEIFVNKQPLTIARYPNDTGILLQKGSDMQRSIYTVDSRIRKWSAVKDAWVGGFFNWAWADDQIPIESIDINKNCIHLKEAPMFGFDTGFDFRRWYALNIPEELDIPGEYYMDRNTGILYFYPPKGNGYSQVEISVLQDPLVSLSGMQHVIFQNITFENMRGIAVYMERGKDNSIQNCTFRNIGMVAVVIGKGVAPFKNYVHNGTGSLQSETIGSLYEHLYENTATDRDAGNNNGIRNCLIYNVGNGGVSLGGGNRKTLIAANNYVIGCNIHCFNRLGKTYKGAVNVDGVGNIVEGNHFYDARQLAIYLIGNNHTVQDNEIDHVCQDVDDMGAVYNGYNPSEDGNAILGNYFHHILPAKNGYRVTGIFLDDGTSNFTINKNTFYKTGSADFGAICISGGRGNNLTNNVFVDCKQAIQNFPWNEEKWNTILHSPLWQSRLHQAVNIDSKVYMQYYPNLSKQLSGLGSPSTAERNVALNCTVFTNDGILGSNNWITNTDPGFINLAKANFNFKPDAVVVKRIAGFEDTQVKNAGAMADRAGNPYDPFVFPQSR